MEDIKESKIRYLEMVQAIITRMASNSFILKGWAVTLIAGIFALASKDADRNFFLIAYVPIVLFWFLDSYYLQLECKYRALFEIARKSTAAEIDFNLNINNIDISKKDYKKIDYFRCVVSVTEIVFYLPIAILVAIVIMFIK